jgi:hypothetical protein
MRVLYNLMGQHHTKPDWQAPTLLVSCLVAGAVFAIGHHAFYASLDGSVVSSEVVSIGLRTKLLRSAYFIYTLSMNWQAGRHPSSNSTPLSEQRSPSSPTPA